MKLQTNLVAVKKIDSSVDRSSFSIKTIEKAANLILEVEGTIEPIILRRTSLESYEVIDGHFAYYAAVRAREISPMKGEMIQAIIVQPEQEKALLEQVDLFRKDLGNNNEFKDRFADLEKVFRSQFEELRKDNRNLERSLAEMTSKVRNSSLGEELIEVIVKRVVEALQPLVSVPNLQKKSSGKKSIDELKQNPLDLNAASQEDLMTVDGIGKATALAIVKKRETTGKFASFEELSSIKGIKAQMREYFTIR
jgi:DNA uptake protein ComE-like DNA-binding protein